MRDANEVSVVFSVVTPHHVGVQFPDLVDEGFEIIRHLIILNALNTSPRLADTAGVNISPVNCLFYTETPSSSKLLKHIKEIPKFCLGLAKVRRLPLMRECHLERLVIVIVFHDDGWVGGDRNWGGG